MSSHYLKYDSEVISERRSDPITLRGRIATWALTRFSFCRWYRLSSCKMERAVLHSLATKRRAALIHVFWGDHDLGYLDLLTSRKQNPLCATFHNCDDTLRENIRFPSRVRSLDAVILVSETQRPFFEECGVVSDRIHVIYHGVDTEFFRLSTARHADTFQVLSVGTYRRNFPLLRAVAGMLLDVEVIRFRVVAASHVRSLFADLPNVTFRSGLTDRELLDEYKNASCFVASAENATANNALVEAMACGLPIVAERVGGIPEYANEDCAEFVDRNAVSQLTETIKSLAANKQKCVQMGLNSRKRAEELDWRVVADRAERVYTRVFNELRA
jgi:glycosyltransferase involved in cell wall biosynthesis